ncbi:hypothetical protein D3C75_873900 [compost metagenome]
MFRPLDAELIDGQPVVGFHFHPVDQAHEVATGFAVFLVLHRYAADQQAMEQAVGRQLCRQAQFGHLLERILACGQRHRGIKPGDGAAQALDQNHLTVVITLRALAVIRYRRAVHMGVANLCQPAEGFLFQLVFGHSTSLPVFSSQANSASISAMLGRLRPKVSGKSRSNWYSATPIGLSMRDNAYSARWRSPWAVREALPCSCTNFLDHHLRFRQTQLAGDQAR